MCRQYLDLDVSDEKIDKVINLSKRYPSATAEGFSQEYIVVRDRMVKRALAEAAFGQSYLAKAPVIIVVVSDIRKAREKFGDRAAGYYNALDGSFSAMLILLTAVNEGLGAGFVGAFDDELVQEILGIPYELQPIGLVPVGFCAGDEEKLPAHPAEKLLHK